MAEGTGAAEFVVDECQHVIRSIIARRLGASPEFTRDIDDVSSEALIALLTRLDDSQAEPIESVTAYAAVVAYHAADEYFRRRFPQRHWLKNKLRYLLKPERGFDWWQSGSSPPVCGRPEWRNRRPSPMPALPGSLTQLDPGSLLNELFRIADGPVVFDELVDAVARLWGVTDRIVSLDEAESEPAKQDFGAVKDHLGHLWREILLLPLNQRIALLLNLKSEDRECPITALPATGVASIADIAVALEIDKDAFFKLWGKLPLNDLEIAGQLGIERQQVINLRKSARKRLERRLKEVISDLF